MTNKILCIKLAGNSFEDWFSLKFREHDCDIIGWQEFYDAGSDRYLGEGIKRLIANFPGFYNSSHTADRFSASRISFMHDFPEMRGSQL